MISLPGIVLIDDKDDELKEIHDSFVRSGIPCLPIHYQNNEPDNATGIDHIDTSKLTPRVVITDLNLTEGSLRPVDLVGPIANLLKHLIKHGPYLLYFWSKNASKVEEVMNILESRHSKMFQLPIHWGVIDKKDFKGKQDELKEKVLALLKENPVFHALFDWENRVAKAAQETTNSLYQITYPPQDNDGISYQDQHCKTLSDTLAVIGNEALGNKNAEENPDIALDMGLAPVLNDRLSVMKTDVGVWQDAVPDIGKHIEVSEETKANLNSFYHVEPVEEQYPKNCKGVFVQISREILDNADKKLKFEQKLGRDVDTILTDEFISTRKLDGKTKDEMRFQRDKAKSSVTLGFIELSADCDQAQRKTKLHRYVLAALIPQEHVELTYYEHNGIKRDRSHEGIYRVPTIKLNENTYTLLISYRYQIGTVPSSKVKGNDYENKWLDKPLFRLKEQILGDISFRCSQHSVRPGIVAFH